MPLLRAAYIGHKGNASKIEFGKDDEGLFINEHDLYNYSWNVQTRGNRIVGADRKGIKERNLPLVIVAPTREKAVGYLNDLFSIFESDLQAGKKGRLVVNGYNLKCFVRGQDYTEWANETNSVKISAKVISDSIWYKTLEPITFLNSGSPVDIINIPLDDDMASPDAGSGSQSWSGGGKGYYHGYPYDYPATREEYSFVNEEGVSLSWKAIIYGPATSIWFSIAGHMYSVLDLTLEAGEWLEITAKESMNEKTIIKYEADGDTENCFAYRDTSSYIFEPIPMGVNNIKFEQGLTWRLSPIVERSSPKWL